MIAGQQSIMFLGDACSVEKCQSLAFCKMLARASHHRREQRGPFQRALRRRCGESKTDPGKEIRATK
jgi:hypothetical protein